MVDRRSRQLLLDPEVQSALLWRVVGYWFFCLISVGVMLILWSAYTGPPRRSVDLLAEVFARYAPALVASLVLLPLVLVDILRLSHRFVGPVVRLRHGLRQLGLGQRPQPVKFRDGDFWPELAGEFNQAAEHIEETRDGLVASQMTNSLT